MGTRRSLQLNTLVLKTLLLLFYGASGTNCSTAHGNTTDRRSLLDFKEAIIDDPKGTLRDWNDNIHHCMWPGVSCSTRHPGRVTELQLGDLNFTGQITPSIGNLTFLRELNLSYNHFSGKLPPLNRLIKLKYLLLYENLLHESIQDALISLTNCSELEWLDLSFNMLVGSIPRNIGSLSSLIALNLWSNSLTGNIPPTFSNITHLADIHLDDNQLEGSIPEELFQLPDIEVVTLRSNRLSGRVPAAAFFNQTSLIELVLSMNALRGKLPSNMLVDSIPRNIGSLSNLIQVSLSSNSLTGNIPPTFSNFTHLVYIYLDDNQLEGSIPEELFQLPDIAEVILSSNRLSGRVPAAFFNQSSLKYLDLSMNALSGTLPSDIGDTFPNLGWLSLGTNNFEGHIPASLGNASMLYHLDVSSNYFTGQIR